MVSRASGSKVAPDGANTKRGKVGRKARVSGAGRRGVEVPGDGDAPVGLAIQQRPVSSLIPYVRNARTHSEAQVAQIAASIREFGWTNPILVDGENGVIAGHGRLAAARLLGLNDVPVIELKHLSKEQKRAYIIADNKLAANAGWDTDFLKLELVELQELGVDLDLTGFSGEELKGLLELNELPPSVTGDEETPLNFNVSYGLIFDDEEQQRDWFSFLRYLKGKYPEAESIGLRLQLFIREGGFLVE